MPLNPCLKTPLSPYDSQGKIQTLRLRCKIFHDRNPPYLSRLTTLCTLTYCHFEKLTPFIFPYKYQLLSYPVSTVHQEQFYFPFPGDITPLPEEAWKYHG